MPLSIEEVRKIAALARIGLTKEEEERHAVTMSSVLDFVGQLNEVNTDGVQPTAQVTGLEDVFRADEVVECEYKKGLLEQMPDLSVNLLKVPAVFENSDEE